MSIPIEHLIHLDWTECKANEPDMHFKMEIENMQLKIKAVVGFVRELKMTAHDVEKDF
jgi:hypothetical protein